LVLLWRALDDDTDMESLKRSYENYTRLPDERDKFKAKAQQFSSRRKRPKPGGSSIGGGSESTAHSFLAPSPSRTFPQERVSPPLPSATPEKQPPSVIKEAPILHFKRESKPLTEVQRILTPELYSQHKEVVVQDTEIEAPKYTETLCEILDDSVCQNWRGSGLPVPKQMQVFPMVEHIIHPASSDRVVVWTENLDNRNREKTLPFTASVTGESESDYLVLEVPSTLTTDMVLGMATPLLPRSVLLIPNTESVPDTQDVDDGEPLERDIPEPFVTTRIVDSENEVEIETPVHLSVDENEIFDPGGDHETLFQYEDVENSPGYLGVKPLYMEYAAADQELEDMLDKDNIPRQRLPYFLRFLYPSSMVAVAVKQVEFAVD
jgi:hypothetical protein